MTDDDAELADEYLRTPSYSRPGGSARTPDINEAWREWKSTGRVPDAPVTQIRLILTLVATSTQMEATVPRYDGDLGADFEDYVSQVMNVRATADAWIGREFKLPRGEPTRWPWEEGYDDA